MQTAFRQNRLQVSQYLQTMTRALCLLALVMLHGDLHSETTTLLERALVERFKYDLLWADGSFSRRADERTIAFYYRERMVSYCSLYLERCVAYSVYAMPGTVSLGRQIFAARCESDEGYCKSFSLQDAARRFLELIIDGNESSLPKLLKPWSNIEPPSGANDIKGRSLNSGESGLQREVAVGHQRTISQMGVLSQESDELEIEYGGVFTTKPLSPVVVINEYRKLRPPLLSHLIRWVGASDIIGGGTTSVTIACFKESDPEVWIRVTGTKGPSSFVSVLYSDETKEWSFGYEIVPGEDNQRFSFLNRRISEISCWDSKKNAEK